ncbi:MAG: phage scaffolding protein [Lachnotalea sp.]
MEFLKELLGDNYASLETAINEHNTKPENKDNQIKLGNLATGGYVSKDKFASLEVEKQNLDTQIKTLNSTMATLKKDNADNETLQATIKTHETTIATMKKDYDTKIREMNIANAIQAKLTDTKYADLLAGKFDKTKLSVSEDGTVLGIDEQLTAIKETYKDLFTVDVKGKLPNNKGGSSTGGNNPWSKEHFNLTEQGKLLKENPELAAQYKASV